MTETPTNKLVGFSGTGLIKPALKNKYGSLMTLPDWFLAFLGDLTKEK